MSINMGIEYRIYVVIKYECLLRYLQVEWEVKRGGYRDFSVENMEGSHCKVPLQDNSSDCGLYLLQYAESFLQVDTSLHHIIKYTMCATVCFNLTINSKCSFPFRTQLYILICH